MRFKLSMAKYLIEKDDNNIQSYRKLGFILKEQTHHFTVDTDHEVEIEISNLDELMEFTNIHGELVVSSDKIIIYNGYLE